MSRGRELLYEERLRQISVEGWTHAHDATIVIDVDGLPLIEWPLHIAAEVATALVAVLARSVQ